MARSYPLPPLHRHDFRKRHPSSCLLDSLGLERGCLLRVIVLEWSMECHSAQITLTHWLHIETANPRHWAQTLLTQMFYGRVYTHTDITIMHGKQQYQVMDCVIYLSGPISRVPQIQPESHSPSTHTPTVSRFSCTDTDRVNSPLTPSTLPLTITNKQTQQPCHHSNRL